MARRIKVRAVLRPEPDVQLYVLALIELARQLREQEQQAAAGKADSDCGGQEDGGPTR